MFSEFRHRLLKTHPAADEGEGSVLRGQALHAGAPRAHEAPHQRHRHQHPHQQVLAVAAAQVAGSGSTGACRDALEISLERGKGADWGGTGSIRTSKSSPSLRR